MKYLLSVFISALIEAVLGRFKARADKRAAADAVRTEAQLDLEQRAREAEGAANEEIVRSDDQRSVVDRLRSNGF